MKVISKSLMAAALTLGFMAVSVAPVLAHAVETTKEEMKQTGRDVKAKSKKGANRVKEAVCAEGDVKCAAKKVGHRADETGDSISNSATEMKEKAN